MLTGSLLLGPLSEGGPASLQAQLCCCFVHYGQHRLEKTVQNCALSAVLRACMPEDLHYDALGLYRLLRSQ